MLRKIFKTGNSVVVSLPQEYLDALGVQLGNEVELELDRKARTFTMIPQTPAPEAVGIDADFAAQLAAFIGDYGATLNELDDE